jgi:hypothetical protein
MKKAGAWKVKAVDLRRIAQYSKEVERQRKLLALADQLDELPFAGGTADADRGHSVPDR